MEIVIIAALFIILGLAIFWFVVGYKYNSVVSSSSYTRGANIDTGTSGTGNTGKGSVAMTCDADHEICMWRSTAICTGAINGQSNTEGGPESIDGSIKNYGNFEENNTIDLSSQIASQANGQQSFTYNFDGTKMLFGGKICPFANYSKSQNFGQRPQLISTYTCIPKGSTCQSPINNTQYQFFPLMVSTNTSAPLTPPRPDLQGNVPALKEYCDSLGNCAGFNTSGYFVSFVDEKSFRKGYTNPTDGFYAKLPIKSS